MTQQEKRQTLTQAMNTILAQIQEGNGQDWIKIYAKLSIEIWGDSEIKHICRTLSREDEQMDTTKEFLKEVHRALESR